HRPGLLEFAGSRLEYESALIIERKVGSAFTVHQHGVEICPGPEDQVIFEAPRLALSQLEVDAGIERLVMDRLVGANVGVPLRGVLPTEIVESAGQLFEALHARLRRGTFESEEDTRAGHAIMLHTRLTVVPLTGSKLEHEPITCAVGRDPAL